MPKQNNHRSALFGLAAAALAVACGDPADPPGNLSGDIYNGVVDGSALDVKFQPTSTSRSACQGANACYLPQFGFAKGNPIAFYNASGSYTAAIVNKNLPNPLGPGAANHNSDGTGGFHADTFRNANCTPRRGGDPVAEAFPTDRQFPVVDALPVAPSSTAATAIALPFVAVYDVPTEQGQCNDIKRHDSVGDPAAGAPGLDGAVRGATPTQFEVWLPMDPSAAFFDLTGASAPMPMAWFKGLLLGAVGSGNKIPLSSDGTTFLFMEGALVNPASGGYSNPNDKNAVVLPYGPSDPPATSASAGWSPLVHLHNFQAATGKKIGDYKGICTSSTCPANFIKQTDLGSVYNTVFIVPSAQ